ncbi:MAG: hypothetical protein HPY96_03335 [Bacilli bacterium]|nr:hypothetical protein [Bacilli bacterium]
MIETGFEPNVIVKVKYKETKSRKTIRKSIKTYCRALRKALKYKDEALSLIITNLSYAITGDDETLNVYAIENQIKEVNQTIDDNVLLASKTKGDKTKYEQAINDMSNQIVILREQLSLAKEKLNSNQVVKL